MRRRGNQKKGVVLAGLVLGVLLFGWIAVFYHHVTEYPPHTPIDHSEIVTRVPKQTIASILLKEAIHVKEELPIQHHRSELECPEYDASIDALQIPLKHLPRKKKTSVAQKYDRRAHNCAGNGIWNRVTIDDHKKILNGIVRIAGIKKGASVLDWGSGCGHSLHILSEAFNTRGVGIDVSNLTIAYARANTSKQNMHCVADGTRLDWIPNNHFDHAISFGSIYHVYNRTMFCHVLRQLVRTVRPGGSVYNGWTENAEYKRDHIEMCLTGLPVTFKVLEERKEFSNVPIFPLKSQQDVPNTYSLLINKLKATDDGDEDLYTLDGCPIRCGIHKCELVERANVAPTRNNRFPSCPSVDPNEFDNLQIPLEHLPRKKKTSVAQKYDRRAHNCAGNGIWHAVTIKDHEDILETIGTLVKARKGHQVFDWGAGCGHQLEFLSEKFGTTGLGIDVSGKSVAYALENTSKVNSFCVADGSKLDWIPNDTFNSAISFGSIYHVYNKTKFCSVIQQLVRITKPGGFVFNGWTEDIEFESDALEACVNSEGTSHTVQILKESAIFKHVAHFPLKAKRKSPNTYSLLVEVSPQS